MQHNTTTAQSAAPASPSLGPIIFRKGWRVYLRPISAEDIPAITVWINDWEIHQFLGVTTPSSLDNEESWRKKLLEKEDQVVFAICLIGSNELIGVMGLHRINHLDGTAVTGSFIGRKDLWSKGYGTEAKMLVLEYAFNTLNLRKIHANVYDFNPRSHKALEKCGYREEGCLKQDRYRNGRYVDVYQMAVFKDRFLPLWKTYQKEQSEARLQSRSNKAKKK